jgi:hypothetical protein
LYQKCGLKLKEGIETFTILPVHREEEFDLSSITLKDVDQDVSGFFGSLKTNPTAEKSPFFLTFLGDWPETKISVWVNGHPQYKTQTPQPQTPIITEGKRTDGHLLRNVRRRFSE